MNTHPETERNASDLSFYKKYPFFSTLATTIFQKEFPRPQPLSP